MAKITADERNCLARTINRARAKWGLSQSASNVSDGTVPTAGDYNNLVNLTNELKSKSGAYNGAIETHVGAGTNMIRSKLANLESQANAMYNYCRCHQHCSGTCTNTCSGTCSGGCGGSCGGNCYSSQPGH